jgi:hypothetical protein
MNWLISCGLGKRRVRFLSEGCEQVVGNGIEILLEGLGPPQKHLTFGVGLRLSKVVEVVAVALHFFIASTGAVTHFGSLHEVVGTGLSVE